MSLQLQQLLPLILFLPWFAVLAGLFWWYPRQPRTAVRRLFDLVAIAIAVIACGVVVRWAHGYAVPTGPAGNIWRQVLATASGYGVFLAVMLVAWLVRRRWLRGASHHR
ncbi:hypothetical protein DWG18_11615 [Lysobacter sp. TY2-98]|uniref:hypothetical protein n=1 Tax=Lysobacter sp. TY2-98 TaxID=2290922 RepID=UPI000E202F44|nr:hypothetical protein [Lysobacter sp. TY2-98]AXK72864.1 hypothetical protein DWG18_11615 [Lysobacter sp. TY2-98]